MKNLIFTTYYILLTISVFSQTTYSKIYNPKGYGASGMNIIEINDSNYIFDLISKDAQTYFALNRNILTTDIYGDSVLSVTLGIDSHNIYNAFSILKNSYIVLIFIVSLILLIIAGLYPSIKALCLFHFDI
jgi:hypothetical protein